MSERIPEGWKHRKLGDLADRIEGGGTPSRTVPEYWGGDILWSTVKDLMGTYLSSTEETITELGLKQSSSRLIPSDTIILATRMAVGKAVVFNTNVAINQDLKAFFHKSIVDPKFLLQLLLSKSSYLETLATGSTVKGIRLKELRAIPVKIPPLPEQKKIASILTSVDEAIENAQKQIDKLQDLKKATMNELLTKGIGHTEFKDSELGRIPKGWEVKDIASSNIQVLDGDRGSEYPKEYDFEQSGYCLFLSAKNVTRSGFKFDETVFISRDKDRKLQKGRLKRNDIVITTRGTVGNIAFFDESVVFDVIRINSGMAIIRNDNECLQTNFLYLILSSEFVTLQLENLTFGSAQPQLTIGTLNELKILIPTVDEQKEISNVVYSINQLITVTTKKLLQTQSLKKSLMQDLLTGKVRVKVN